MTAHWNTAVREFYARLGITLLRSSGNEAPARCFASPAAHRHEDRHPSVSVSLVSGAWFCHGCGARGGGYDAAVLRGHSPRSAMDLLIAHGLAEPRASRRQRHRVETGNQPLPPRVSAAIAGPTRVAINAEEIGAWASRLTRDIRLLNRLLREREIALAALSQFEIGFDGRRITIPTRDEGGSLTGLLRWEPFDRGPGPKMLAVPGTQRDLFPSPESLASRQVVLCEGEPDALAVHSAGMAAVSIPGVAAWRKAWTERFAEREVRVVFDCDGEGRAAAATVETDLREAGVDVVLIDLDRRRNDGYDLTDYLRELRLAMTSGRLPLDPMRALALPAAGPKRKIRLAAIRPPPRLAVLGAAVCELLS